MGNYLLQMFGISLLLTLLIEWLVAFLWGIRGKKGLLLVTLVNIVTNPAAVLTYWLYRVYCADTSIVVQIGIEIVVVVVEALIYQSFAKEESFRIKWPIALGIVANALSWGVGVLWSVFERSDLMVEIMLRIGDMR